MSLTVSVIVPVRNEEDRIAATLESIRTQTYGDIIEVLVADGRSTDQTVPVAAGVPGRSCPRQPGSAPVRGLERHVGRGEG